MFENQCYLVSLHLNPVMYFVLIFPLGLLITSFPVCGVTLNALKAQLLTHADRIIYFTAHLPRYRCCRYVTANCFIYSLPYRFIFYLKLVTQRFLDLRVYVHVQSLKITR
jgi:hypothetical protein